jgi:hypothetical protein
MRAFLCEAVRSRLEFQALQDGIGFENRCRVLVEVCRGSSDGSDFEAAAALDAATQR